MIIGRKDRKRVQQMERILASQIKIYYRPGGLDDYPGIGDPLFDLSYEHLYFIWKFGGYENDGEWHTGIHLGGASYLTMVIK